MTVSARVVVDATGFARSDSDTKIDRAFTYLGYLTPKELIDVLFYYKRGELRKGLFRYPKSKPFAVLAKGRSVGGSEPV